MTASQKEPLTRLTVNLTPRAARSLALAAELTGDSKTDVVNRALQFYAYAEHVIASGGEVLAREDGNTTKILFSYPDPLLVRKTSKILLSYPDPRASQQEAPA